MPVIVPIIATLSLALWIIWMRSEDRSTTRGEQDYKH